MKIVFIVYHPVDPQVVRFMSQKLIERGHSVLFLIYEKENIIEKIVSSYGFRYEVVGKNPTKNRIVKNFFLLLKLNKKIKKFNPDIIFSPTSPYSGVVSYFNKATLISWADTETATKNLKVSLPFVDSLLVADTFYYNFTNDKKIIKYSGYKELAYLHPNWFRPDSSRLRKLGIDPEEKIVLLRFSALKAMHDIGLTSVVDSKREKILHYIKELEKYARVFISMTEKKLGPEFEKYRLQIHPAEYTNFLAHCTLYIGEGTTTASEAGVLGVPWVAIRPHPLGYLEDQEKKFGLGFRTDNIDIAFKKGIEWLQDDTLLDNWKKKRATLLNEKIDVSAFFVWFIENYPKSFKIMKEQPDFQLRFK